jgi:SEC-C motif-containing protein
MAPGTQPTDPCPCGSGEAEAACCAPILAGSPARTALALMRSRYTAFVRGDIDHLVTTHAETTRAGLDVQAMARWSRETRWLGLEILTVEGGGEGDDIGVVEFVARGKTRGQPFAHRERSRFNRHQGRWYYVDAF